MSDSNQKATTDYTVPLASLGVGTTHGGFTVTDAIALPELSGYAYVFRHDASGARALWLACPDDNKSFAIAFKTPPANSTGVFHILEHSVLCGSDRFPVKEPFVNLLKSSMQTFLNALTFADKTMYPVASTNITDLENLMDVYLDAVLHPAIYHRPRIFEQEGWHLELASPDAPLTYNGVVFNEMKGALSDPDEVLFEGLNRQLFPDTPYRFESGGDPRVIPTLTYEEFLDTHARHYNLGNSYTILYGDLDVDRELAFVDERFQRAEDRGAGAPNPLPLQQPVKAPLAQVEMATAPENATVGLAYVIGTSRDHERVLATDILLDAIAGSNESPLKRAILDAGICDDFDAILYDGELQPRVIFQLKGSKPGVAEDFRALLERTCSDLVRDGIGHDRLAASLAQGEFSLREGEWGSYSDGVALAIKVMSSWLYDDERPVDYLRFEDAIARMKAGLDEGYFEDLLRSLVLESTHCAEVELVPTQEGSATDEARELEERKAGMSPAELQSVMDEVAALRAEQEAPDAPEALAKLPQLGIADIGPAREEPKPLDVPAPLPCIAHELDTRRIDYVYHYFDLRRVAYDELPYVGVLSDLLGKLATDRLSAAELDTLIELDLGSLDFFCETYTRQDDPSWAKPVLVVGASSLSEKVDRLAQIPQEVWATTDFSDTDRIQALLQQRRIGLEQHFTNSGHSAALARLSTYYSPASEVSDALGGVGYYLFLKDLLAHFDERKDSLVEKLHDLSRRIFTRDEVTVSFTGSARDRELFWEKAGGLGLPTAGADVARHRLVAPQPQVRNEAFVIPTNVAFVGEGSPLSVHDTSNVGAWTVAQRVLSYDYLWNEVRVKGGAYGVGFRRTLAGLEQFWSYRDPSIDATVARYEAASSWLASWNPSPSELTGYIVSTVASHDAPVKPRQLARRQDIARFSHTPDGWRDLVRSQELACSAEDVHALAASLGDLPGNRGFCVFGSREKVEASKLDLTVVDLMGGRD